MISGLCLDAAALAFDVASLIYAIDSPSRCRMFLHRGAPRTIEPGLWRPRNDTRGDAASFRNKARGS